MTDELYASRRGVEPTQSLGPTTRRRQLAYRLLALRKAADLTAEEAGARAGVSKATVSRYETSRGNVRWNQVDMLCRVYDAPNDERQALIELAKTCKVTDGWWVPGAGSLPSALGMLIALENEAESIRQYASSVIPGLLQTSSYARSIKGTPGYELPQEQVETFLDTRMRRQQLLDQPNHPRYQVLLDESVLRRVVGGAEVMAEQLDYLLERGAHPDIAMQVLPFSRGAYSAALTGFMILGASDPAYDVIYAENTSGSLYLERDEERGLYSAAFNHLHAEALSIESSAEMIAEARKKHLRA